MVRSYATAIVLILSSLASAATVVRTVNTVSNDLRYDPVNGRFYASLPSSVGAGGNSLRIIDPATATLGSSVFVGSEPAKIAVSDNGQYAYVGLQGAAAVRRVTLSTFTADLQFGLGSDPFLGLFYVEDMSVMPGHPETIAVSRQNQGFSPRHEGVAIYDNGVARATTTPGHTGSNVIEFGATPDVLYGYNNETTEFGLRTMSITAGGVQTTSTVAGLISGFGVDFDYGGGKLVSTTGRVIDAATSTLLGTIGSGSSVVVEDDGSRAYVLQGSSVGVYNLSTFLLQDTINIPGLSNGSGLVRWGSDGLALRTPSQVYLINSTAVPEPAGLGSLAVAAGLLFTSRRRRARA